MNNNKVQQAIYESVVKPAMEKKLDEVVGRVVGVDYDKYLADVLVANPATGQEDVLEDVPITIDTEGGVSGAALREGHHVVVAFHGGEGSYPRIIRREILDYRQYREELQAVQGTFVPDAYGYL